MTVIDGPKYEVEITILIGEFLQMIGNGQVKIHYKVKRTSHGVFYQPQIEALIPMPMIGDLFNIQYTGTKHGRKVEGKSAIFFIQEKKR